MYVAEDAVQCQRQIYDRICVLLCLEKKGVGSILFLFEIFEFKKSSVSLFVSIRTVEYLVNYLKMQFVLIDVGNISKFFIIP